MASHFGETTRLPFLIFGGLALATAIGGVTKIIDNNERIDNARERARNAENRARRKQDAYQEARKRTEQNLRELGEARLSAIKTMHQAAEFLGKCRLKDRSLNDQLRHRSETLQHWTPQAISALEASIAVGEATAVGVLTSLGVFSAAGTIGVASTGTAINSLSGVVATRATLAYLGGGSLATGGLGMAGGAAVLGGLVIGPALLVGSWIHSCRAEEIETESDRYCAQVDQQMAQIQQKIDAHQVIDKRIAEIGSTIRRLEEHLRQTLANSNPNIDQDAYAVYNAAVALGKMVDTPVLTEST